MAGEKSSAWANALLLLLFNNVNVANVGDATGLRGSATAGNLYLSLHTADPGPGGNQSSSEVAYTSYVRLAVPRSPAGFTVTGNIVVPAALAAFVTGTGGTGTAAFFGVGTSPTGAGMLLYSGPIAPTIATGNGIAPQLTTGTEITES